MTGSNMKSDLTDVSRLKVEGRQSIHRRRMSKNSGPLSPTFENGDQTCSNVSVMQEKVGVKTVKDKDADIKKGDHGRRHVIPVISPGENIFSSENSGAELHGKHDELTKVKDLMLAHLDLIQQQQDLLLAKDKEIKSLRQERDTLKCRLERMERRVSLTKGRGDGASPLDSPSNLSTQTNKRKLSLEPQSLNKKFAASEDLTEESRPISRFIHLAHHSRRERQRQRNRLVKLHYNRSRSKVSSPEFPQPKPVSLPPRYSNSSNFLHTSQPYYVPQVEEFIPEVISPVKPDKEDVQVPTWKVVVIQRGYTMEGTENITDEAYNKRHQKPEQEEKRRKRWDVQRMREQQMYEKLQQGRAGSTPRKSSNTMSRDAAYLSFLPDPDNIEYIHVDDEIPVSAFGYPIPVLSPREFQVPWADLDKREREEKSHKSPRKRR